MADLEKIVKKELEGHNPYHGVYVHEVKAVAKGTTVQLDIDTEMDEVSSQYYLMIQYNVGKHDARIRNFAEEKEQKRDAAGMFPEDVEAQFNKKIEAEEEKKKKAMETIATHHVVMNVTESKYIEEGTRIKFRVSQKQAIFFLQMRMNMADYIVYMVNPTKLLKESIEDRLHETPFITLENK